MLNKLKNLFPESPVKRIERDYKQVQKSVKSFESAKENEIKQLEKLISQLKRSNEYKEATLQSIMRRLSNICNSAWNDKRKMELVKNTLEIFKCAE